MISILQSRCFLRCDLTTHTHTQTLTNSSGHPDVAENALQFNLFWIGTQALASMVLWSLEAQWCSWYTSSHFIHADFSQGVICPCLRNWWKVSVMQAISLDCVVPSCFREGVWSLRLGLCHTQVYVSKHVWGLPSLVTWKSWLFQHHFVPVLFCLTAPASIYLSFWI